MKCYFALVVLQSFLINKLWGKFKTKTVFFFKSMIAMLNFFFKLETHTSLGKVNRLTLFISIYREFLFTFLIFQVQLFLTR